MLSHDIALFLNSTSLPIAADVVEGIRFIRSSNIKNTNKDTNILYESINQIKKKYI